MHQRAEQPPLRAQAGQVLGVPLHADDELRALALDGLDDAVAVARDHAQAAAQPAHGLLVLLTRSERRRVSRARRLPLCSFTAFFARR